MANSILEESQKARKRGWLGWLLRKKVVFIVVGVLAIAGGAYAYYNQKNQTQATAVALKQWTVRRQDLKIAIQATGNVVSKDQVSLSFPVSGNLEVDNVYVKQGDTVKKGDKIASVKTESLALALQSAYNNYQAALDNLNSKEAPPTDSSINSAKASIVQAQLAVQQAQISLEQTTASANSSVASAQSALDSAQNNLQLNSSVANSAIVNNAYNSLVNTIKPVSVTLQKALLDADLVLGVDNANNNAAFKSLLGIMNPSTFYAAQASYKTAETDRQSLDSTIADLNSSDTASVDSAAQEARQALVDMQTTLNGIQTMLNATVTSNNLSQTQLSAFQSTNSSDLSSVNSSISGLDSAVQAVASAKTSLGGLQIAYNQAQANLKNAQTQAQQSIATANNSLQAKVQALAQAQTAYNDLIAPPREVDIASAKTQLTSAAIAVQQAQYNLSQATLVAPIDGVISALNYKVGDIILQNGATSGTSNTVATIINTNTLYIEANVEEADISKLKVGDKADVTFDAIPGLDLQGTISYISLTSTTNSNGIVTYLVRVEIDNVANSPVREGMTASLNFITAEAPNVLTVPVEAVRNVNDQPSVELASGQFVPVVTGFTDGTDVEIKSGLKAGDVVLY